MSVTIPQEEIEGNALDAVSASTVADDDGSGSFNSIQRNGRTGRSAGGEYAQTGYIFTGVPIPRNAKIISATLNVRWDSTRSDTVVWVIKGIDTDDAAVWSTNNRPGTGGSPGRPDETTAGVAWGRTGSTGGDRVDAPDISSLIEEIVNRSGWNSGNDLAVVIRNDGTNTGFLDIRHRLLGDGDGVGARFDCTYEIANVIRCRLS